MFRVNGTVLRTVRACLVGLSLALAGAAMAAEQIVIDPQAYYPEGPLATADGVIYAEMGRDRVMRWDGKATALLWSLPGCGPTAAARFADGYAILCHLANGIALIGPSGETRALIGRDSNRQPVGNPNAAANDAKGGVYFSSSGPFAPGAPSQGAVLYLAADGTLRRVAEGIHYANGVAVSADGGTLFVSEHLSRRVLAFDIAADGSLSGRRTFVALDDLVGTDPGRSWEVGPDGLATDAAGNLYVGEYGGGRFLVVSPEGRLLHTIDLPERYTTGVALSPDESRLYLAAPASLGAGVPGKVYAVDNPVRD